MKLDLISAWNTGRGYTANGQRIAAWVASYDGDGDEKYFDPFIVMRDYDRELEYTFAIPFPGASLSDRGRDDLRAYVQECYDFNKGTLYGLTTYDGIMRCRLIDATALTFLTWSPIYI